MKLVAWVRAELGVLLRSLARPVIWMLLALMLLLAVAAYRVPLRYRLDVGGLPDVLRYDRPYLVAGFNRDTETIGGQPPISAFKWAFEDARLVFPGVGQGVYAAELDVATGQPAPSTPSAWSLGTAPLVTLALAPTPRVYHVLVPAPAGDLDLRIHTPPFHPSNDRRDLGFAVDAFGFASLDAALPAVPVLAWLAGCLLVSCLLLIRCGVPTQVVVAAGAGEMFLLAALLVWQRLGLTTFLPRLAAILLAAYIGTIMLLPLIRSGARGFALDIPRGEVQAIAGLAALAFVIRLGGMLHPQAYTSDLGLHVNNLISVTAGRVLFTEGLPSEAGGGQAPYPPGGYVALLPWQLFASPRLVVQAGNACADSLVVMWLWLLLRAGGAAGDAALFAGALYLFATPLLTSFSIGEMANIWGQSVVAPMALLLLRWRQGLAPSALLFAGLLVAFLGHSGVFLSLLAFFAVYLALLMLERGPWLRLGALIACAVLVVGGAYYSAFLQQVAGRSAVPRIPFGFGWLWHVVRLALEPDGRIGIVLAALGGIGLWQFMARPGALRPLVLAWWLSVLLTLVPLLWSRQTVRWEAFLFPALALCGGLALGDLRGRGRASRTLSYVLLGLVVFWGAARWYLQILTYQHA